MKKSLSVSLIISTYNWPEALDLCLNSIVNQTRMPNEILIADDGSSKETKNIIDKYKNIFTIPLIHVWQDDIGFRKAIILNKVIDKSSGDYIIQIDGDIILNPHFIEDHIMMAEKGCFIRGTRSNLNWHETSTILKKKNIPLSSKMVLAMKEPANTLRFNPMLAQFFFRKELSGKRVKGCNMSFWREDLLNINGYDSKLHGWGHEDEELSWRLINLGIQKKIIKFSAIAYHLYHKQSSRTEEPSHVESIQNVITNKIVKTENGIEEIRNIVL